MTDLSFCYLHMSRESIFTLDFPFSSPRLHLDITSDTIDVPEEHIPPDPDDADCLPSQIHPSYPYGNPTKLTHPAALGTAPFGFGNAHLYNQLVYDTTIQNTRPEGPLRWPDLGLDQLLPMDPKKLEAELAAKARKMATGAVQQGNSGGGQQHEGGGDGDGDGEGDAGGDGEAEGSESERSEEDGGDGEEDDGSEEGSQF